jgi:hypothetical protein
LSRLERRPNQRPSRGGSLRSPSAGSQAPDHLEQLTGGGAPYDKLHRLAQRPAPVNAVVGADHIGAHGRDRRPLSL